MLTRIGTAAVGIPIVFAAIYFGGPVFLLFLALISVLALRELNIMLAVSRPVALATACLATIPYFAFLTWPGHDIGLYVLAYLVIALPGVFVFGQGRLTYLQSMGLVLGGLFLPLMLSTLHLVRLYQDGAWLVAAVLLITWGTDTGAYFAGMLLGRAKLAPSISPNKTWAGAWGGLIAGAVIALALGRLAQVNWVLALAWGLTASVLGQLGDLTESVFKRQAGVKDSGNLLPGHGGFLDRVDSLLFTATVSYLWFGLVF